MRAIGKGVLMVPETTGAQDADIDAIRRLGGTLRRLRRERGLSQRDLVQPLNIGSHTVIVEFELGRRIPAADIVSAYERHFGIVGGMLHRLRAQALVQRAAVESPRRPSGTRRTEPRLLPPIASHFTGRAAQLTTLDQHLDVGRSNPVLVSTITGASGIGKTALAVQWGHLARHRFPDGDLYVDLRGYHSTTSPMTGHEALGVLLAALGVSAQQMPAATPERTACFRALMEGKRALLVLDNARSTKQIRPLLPDSESCAVLITSRHRLGGLVAHNGVHRITLDALSPDDARRLLRYAIGPERVDSEPGAAAALAELCAGHPLALRIAAQSMAAAPGARIADAVAHLSDRRGKLDALHLGDDEASAIRSVFSWSYLALGPEPQRLFRLLGLHQSPEIDVAAACALADRPTWVGSNLLGQLLAAHLLEAAGDGRFRMHDLLRLLARERAEIEGEADHRGTAHGRLAG